MMNSLSSSSNPSKWSPEREGVQLQTPRAEIPFAPFVGLQPTPATRQQICEVQTFPEPFTAGSVGKYTNNKTLNI